MTTGGTYTAMVIGFALASLMTLVCSCTNKDKNVTKEEILESEPTDTTNTTNPTDSVKTILDPFELDITYKELVDSLKKEEIPYIEQKDRNRLLYATGESTLFYIGLVDTRTMVQQWIPAGGNNVVLFLLKTDDPDKVNLFTIGGSGGYVWLSTIDLKKKKEISCREIEANYFIFKDYTKKGYKGTMSYRTYETNSDKWSCCYEVELDYKGNIIWQSEEIE